MWKHLSHDIASQVHIHICMTMKQRQQEMSFLAAALLAHWIPLQVTRLL